MTARRIANRLTPYAFLVPALAVMAVALLYPLTKLTWFSFTNWEIGLDPRAVVWLGWQNYAEVFQDPVFLSSLRITLVFALTVVAVELFLGVALALLLERPVRGMSLFRTLFILPMMVAPIVVGLVWRYIYNPTFGPANRALAGLGLPTINWLGDPSFALAAVIIADIWQWTPFILILTLAALQGLPRSALEAARMDGASTLQTILYIKLPLMMPVLVVAALLRLIDAFKVLEVIYIMVGGPGPAGSTNIMAMHIYETAFVANKLGRAAALSNVLLAVVLVLGIAMFVYTKWREHAAARARRTAEERA